MKLRCLAYAALFGMVVTCSCAQDPGVPEWTLTVKVIDQQNRPVTNALVKIAWHVPSPPGERVALTNVSGTTGDGGVFRFAQRSGSSELMYGAEKQGYYSAGGTHEFSRFKNSDPARWNPAISLVLKQVKNPTAMYAKAVDGGPPVLSKIIGYDLVSGDWVEPYGRGQATDILFEKEYSERSPSEYGSKIRVSFPNRGDGIQGLLEDAVDRTSSLRSPYEAPLNGYLPQVIREISAGRGQATRMEFDPHRVYFIRVRTVLDDTGKIKSACYGKIYGDFMQFTYYLNPTPNDRGLEFDPGTNLIRGQRVDAP